MRLSICITTRNRPQELQKCLQNIWNSTVKPQLVVVSDDSTSEEMQQKNRRIVENNLNSIYLLGPHRGVCANRNNAMNLIKDTDLVSFIDDDVFMKPYFIARAMERYAQMPPQEKFRTLLSGVSEQSSTPVKLSFRGYFCAATVSQCVNLHTAVFPCLLFEKEQWDENIFFGYEDAELCLRAIKDGYSILHCSELDASHSCFLKGTLTTEGEYKLSEYEIFIEAARLYVNIKRYKNIFPNPLKLGIFIITYITHMTFFLMRRQALNVWPHILHRANLNKL